MYMGDGKRGGTEEMIYNKAKKSVLVFVCYKFIT